MTFDDFVIEVRQSAPECAILTQVNYTTQRIVFDVENAFGGAPSIFWVEFVSPPTPTLIIQSSYTVMHPSLETLIWIGKLAEISQRVGK